MDFARVQLRNTINEAREAIWNLRKPDDASSLGEKLESMTQQVSSEFQVPVAWSMSGTPFAVTEPVAHDLLMVAREAVYNSMLHGHPARVDVALTYKSSELTSGPGRRWLRIRSPADGPRERPPFRPERHEGACGAVRREAPSGERAWQRGTHRSAGAAAGVRRQRVSKSASQRVSESAKNPSQRTKKQSGSCDPDCLSEGTKSEGQAEGALEDAGMAVHAADHAENTWGLIHGGRRVGEIRMVGSIEGIPAELEGLSFRQRPVLHDR